MQSTTDFTGLTMPVFTAFGWAGEETAIKFALSQLEAFIGELHANLSREAKEKFPFYGLSEEHQAVYISAKEDVFDDIYITFFARPMSLEMQLAIQNEVVLTKAYKQSEQQPTMNHRLITELGPEWTLRIQQLQVDEDSAESTHYQDVYKDSVASLNEAASTELFSKAAYLNGDARWVAPFYLSKRFDSERVAAMGLKIVEVMADQVSKLMPLADFLTGKALRKKSTKTRGKSKKTAVSTDTTIDDQDDDIEEMFTYTAELKPLHLQRGFINMTAKHWPFFQINSRTETRPVTVYYEGIYDKKCTVWRLLPNDQARLMLSPAVHEWVEEYFQAGDQIEITARKMNDDEIQMSLKPINE
ncbi:MAG: hypothetical protein IAF02_06580 [Anaerolineae bacterium]|nr:hypothetical protein [Anaerolineae bacterium]